MDNLTKDSLIDFFKEPTLENFSEFFEKNIGETNNVDFKGKWIDIDKIAQIALGIANCGGGCIIIGVEDREKQLIASGIQDVKSILDPADFTKKISKYFPKSILNNIQLRDFFYDNDVYGSLKGKKFQVIFISIQDEDLPIICEVGGSSVKKGSIYIRRGTSTEEINYDELQGIIKRKVEAQASKINNTALKEELEQLKVLYDAIPMEIGKYSFSAFKQSPAVLGLFGKEKNTKFPDKSYEEVLLDMIEKETKKIEKIL